MMNRTALALPLMLAPNFALADITPEDVWDNIKATYSAMGLEVSGTPTRAGETLTITDGMVTLTYPIIGGQATATLPQMGLIDQGNGTVRILTPDAYLVEVAADIPNENDQVSFEIAFAVKDMDSIASGEPGDVTYTTSAANYDMIMNALNVPGEDVDFNMEYDSDGFSGTTRITQGDLLTITADIAYRDATTRFSVGSEGFEQQSTSENGPMSVLSTVSLPAGMDIMNLTPALKAGLAMRATMQSRMSSGATTTMMNGELVSEQIQNSGPGNVEFSVDQSGFVMALDATTFDATITQADLIPFPIEINGQGVGARFVVPLVASETPQGFTYAFNIDGLEIAEGLWGMIDPNAGMDRSPIDFAIDLSGDLLWELDVFDAMGWAELEQTDEVPITPLSANINTLALNVLGGSVAGNGGFTFDNTDMMTFPGMPRPEGKASVQAQGLNAVIDQLVATGLLPEDQAGMGRMFMGMFARSTGDDTLESEVEINAEGHLLLNGQRMR